MCTWLAFTPSTIDSAIIQLKTPIATVGVAIEALKNFNALQDPERTREYLDISAQELQRLGLPGFYRRHEAELRKTSTDRELNGTMATVLLRLFEEEPVRWEAVRWLNAEAAPKDEPFAAYLARWRAAVPERHRDFVDEVRKSFGVK